MGVPPTPNIGGTCLPYPIGMCAPERVFRSYTLYMTGRIYVPHYANEFTSILEVLIAYYVTDI